MVNSKLTNYFTNKSLSYANKAGRLSTELIYGGGTDLLIKGLFPTELYKAYQIGDKAENFKTLFELLQ